MNPSFHSNDDFGDLDDEDHINDQEPIFGQEPLGRPDPVAISRMAGAQVDRMNPYAVHRPLAHHAWMAFLSAEYSQKRYFRRRALKEAAASIALLSDVGLAERLVREQFASASWTMLKEYEPIIASFPSLSHLVTITVSERPITKVSEPVACVAAKPRLRTKSSKAAIIGIVLVTMCALVCVSIRKPSASSRIASIVNENNRDSRLNTQGADIVAAPIRHVDSSAAPITPTPVKENNRSPQDGPVPTISVQSLARNSSAKGPMIVNTQDDQFKMKSVSNGQRHQLP